MLDNITTGVDENAVDLQEDNENFMSGQGNQRSNLTENSDKRNTYNQNHKEIAENP